MFIKIFKNKKNKLLFSLFFIFYIFLYFIFQNLSSALYIIKIPLFTLGQKINLFTISLFDISELRVISIFILVLLFSLSLSLLTVLMYNIYSESKKLGIKRNIFSTIGIIISILGISCASCGLGLLVSIFSFFGATYLISYFPFQGLELGYLGLIFLNISNYFLLKRLKSPFTC